MQHYLIDTFLFNLEANQKVIDKIGELPKPEAAIVLMSHLIHSQDKWLGRIQEIADAQQPKWFDTAFDYEILGHECSRSTYAWVEFLKEKTEADLDAEVEYTGGDGARWAAKLQDLALQLNYHNIHHRAQIQSIIRAQGLQPDFVDYIGTRYRRIG